MSNSAASNVIPMRELDRPATNPQEAQFERLLKECQGLAVDRLSRSISAMLDRVEEVLWGLADHTQDREVRDLYIAAKDKALDQRKFIEEQFRKNYLTEFGNRVRADRKQSQDFSRFDLSSLELGLVNDEDLDETLKVNEMAGKLRRYCEEELNALDQRVGVLIGDANLQGEGNPFSPQAICIAYKQTCRQLDANLKLRMVFHRLFDDHVLDDVRSIYKDLNALLIERSILPKIRYGIRRQAGAAGVRAGLPAAGIPGTPMPGMDAAAGAIASNIGYGPDVVGSGEQDFYAVLQGLIAMSAHGGGVPGSPSIPGGLVGGAVGATPASVGGMVQVPGFPPIMGGPVNAGGASGLPGGGVPIGAMRVPERLLQGAELIGSLTRLQQGDLGVIAGAAATLDASVLTAGTTNVVRELKSTQIGSSVDQSDAMTMDIVAMLFDQIFSDKRVPYALKVLIGRLQIPVVKVAVLDKRFFSKKSHPTRRLLDTLGEFAFGLDETFDQNSPVYNKLEGIVQRLLDDFEDDIQIFETLNEDLLLLVRDENERAENAAKDAARKIAYMERLEVGKAVAQFEIKRRAEANRISQLVLNFLADEWVKLLLLAYARHGNDSDAWKSALETMDLLIWSVNHKQSVDERRKLAAMLPGLLKRLQAGLQGAGTDPDRRKQFFSRLMRLHTKVISGNAPARRAAKQGVVPTLTDSISTAANAGPLLETSNAEQPSARAVPLRGESANYGPSTPQNSTASAPSSTETAKAVTPEVDEDAEPATQAPEFSNVTIKNPFGDGDIQIEEISLSDLPGLPELSAASPKRASPAELVDQHSKSVTDLREGDWLEFRDEEDGRSQAKLSYVSPLKGTYLFVNRQGAKVGEYSLYQLAREFRTGRAVLLEAVPLLDRAMSGLVGVLKKNVH